MDGGGHAVRLSRKTTQRRMSLMDEIKSDKHKEGENRCSLEETAPTKAWRCEIVVLERCGGTEMASVWRHERQAFVKSSSFSLTTCVSFYEGQVGTAGWPGESKGHCGLLIWLPSSLRKLKQL